MKPARAAGTATTGRMRGNFAFHSNGRAAKEPLAGCPAALARMQSTAGIEVSFSCTACVLRTHTVEAGQLRKRAPWSPCFRDPASSNLCVQDA